MTADDYQSERADHRAATEPWAQACVRRRAANETHPVWDFLFEYYSFKPSYLVRYSPGAGVTVAGVPRNDLDWPDQFAPAPGGFRLDTSRLSRRRDYLRWAVTYLRTVNQREPFFGCFGLHEWAIVYREEAVRHGRVPLRLSRADTDAVVDAGALRCTHFDAFRFFSPAAAPMNRVQLRRDLATDHDQPGCVHANMDLYKLAHKVGPFVSSATLAAAFRVAVAARELDMRASPYDLSTFGFAPIPIETRAGRDEYVAGQRGVAHHAAPVRARLLAEYEGLLTSVWLPISVSERGLGGEVIGTGRASDGALHLTPQPPLRNGQGEPDQTHPTSATHT